MKWNRFVRGIGFAVILALLVAVFTPLVNVAGRLATVPTDLQPSDAIVVLGAGLMRDGSLNYESAQRFLFGLRLFKEGLAPLLVLSGPARPNTAPESAVRARIAAEMGVSQSAIVQLDEVQTTQDEAAAAAERLRIQGVSHVLLVTGSVHMLRAKLVFEAAGFAVSPASSDDFPSLARSPKERLLLLQELVVHSAGLLYYRLAGIV